MIREVPTARCRKIPICYAVHPQEGPLRVTSRLRKYPIQPVEDIADFSINVTEEFRFSAALILNKASLTRECDIPRGP